MQSPYGSGDDRKYTWANVKATLKTYFDGIYHTVGGALGTPISGTLTNCSGLPLSGVVDSTSEALGVGSLEVGHASDTTITRTGAGDIAVEGNGIYRASGTDVPVTDGGTGASTAAGARTNLGVNESQIAVHQVSHGLSVGNAIKCTGADTFAKAQADSAANAEVVGYVIASSGADDFVYVTSGAVSAGVPAVAAGTVLYLDPSTAGALTATEPTTVGQISKPLMVVTTNATSGVFVNMRGVAISGTGVVALTDGATPALDASLGLVFTLSAAGNRTIAVPTNAVSGRKIIIRHYASGGARTLALNTGAGGFRFGSSITALTETASGKTDYIGCVYNAADSFWDVVAYTKGF